MRKRSSPKTFSPNLFFASGAYCCITKGQVITCINRASSRTPGFFPSRFASPIPDIQPTWGEKQLLFEEWREIYHCLVGSRAGQTGGLHPQIPPNPTSCSVGFCQGKEGLGERKRLKYQPRGGREWFCVYFWVKCNYCLDLGESVELQIPTLQHSQGSGIFAVTAVSHTHWLGRSLLFTLVWAEESSPAASSSEALAQVHAVALAGLSLVGSRIQIFFLPFVPKV